jgi:5-methylcytosine-specific restriction endonuclease McrA
LQSVFVLNSTKEPLTPCHPAKARKLLRDGKASVYRRYPFTILLKVKLDVKDAEIQPLRLKLDPGSKTTGIVIVNDHTGKVLFAAEIEHRGQSIKNSLESRRAIRRSRRNRKTRYRKPRFDNRTRRAGWLPPSLQSRVANVMTWVEKLLRYCPITAISQELVRFDTQLMENAEISSIEYQQGTLYGFELRQYLLEKFKRRCAYCGKQNCLLQVEHIVAKSRGGSNRVSNLTIACKACNERKGNKSAQEFGYPQVQAQAKAPLKDVAALNATRWELYSRLKATGLPLEVGTGGRTKFNRTERGMAKAHWLDAACVGASTPEKLDIRGIKPLEIKAVGHGSRQQCRMNRFGFPRTRSKACNRFFGFRTSDTVKAIVRRGKKKGTYIGKVAVRATGSFNIVTKDKTIQGISYKYCKMVHSADGYSY